MNKSEQSKMLKRFLTMAGFVLITAASSQVHAQNGVGINPTGAAADPSAALDVASTNKGVLVPRMTAAEKVAIASPANGLLIFQTDGVTGFWYYNATTSAWVQAVGPQGAIGPQGPIGLPGTPGANGVDGTSVTPGTIAGNTSYWNGNAWVENNVVKVTPAQNNTTVNSSLTITNTNTAPDNTYSLRIETPKPMLLPRMTKTAINGLAPVEGMMVYNTTAHKAQVYGMVTDNQDIMNEISTATATTAGTNCYTQNFTPSISGYVVAIEVLIKNTGFSDNISFAGNNIPVPSNATFYWLATTLTGNNQIPVFAGNSSSFTICTNNSQLATNSFYPGGSASSWDGALPSGADDIVFRIHIAPGNGNYGWQNLN